MVVSNLFGTGLGSNPTHQEFLLLLLGGLIIKTTRLNDLIINVKFVPRSLIHGLFDALLCNEAENKHGFGLADTMCTILCLKISVRVPKKWYVLAVILRTDVEILVNHQSESKLVSRWSR